jgi:hypothetical protein
MSPYDRTIKEATRLVERTQEVEKESKELVSQKEDDKPEAKTPDVSPERIERMKRAFRPTWLYEQINSNGKNHSKKD